MDRNTGHRINGGNIGIISLFPEKDIIKSVNLRKNGTNFKGKIPEWFKIIEKEVTIEGCKGIKQEYLNKNLQIDNISFRAFNEDERTSIITWNENDVKYSANIKRKNWLPFDSERQ
ncbi:hypothetical protein RhiirB3_432886 [Rhizophagus irregularis]|nr:hypothetical protein RhiirB3_432886 [Rhizophagus irregularis]